VDFTGREYIFTCQKNVFVQEQKPRAMALCLHTPIRLYGVLLN